MASQVQTIVKMMASQGQFNWLTADVRVVASTSAALPSQDGTVYLSAMTGECAGTRTALSGKAISEDTTNKRADLKADDIVWSNLNVGTIATVWIYIYNVSDAAAVVIGVLDPTDLVTNGGNVNVKWDNQASNGKLLSL